MKTIVCLEPDACELALCEMPPEAFVLDAETYYYFRDEVFINGIRDYIKRRYPRQLSPGMIVEGSYHSLDDNSGKGEIRIRPLAGSPAAKCAEWFDTQRVIVKYYRVWAKRQPKFYAYRGSIYSFVFLSFLNVGNEIQLFRYEPEEVANIMNAAYRNPLRWAFKRMAR